MFKDKTLIQLALAQTVIWAGLFYLFPAMLLHWEEAFGWTRAQLTAAITLAMFVSAFTSPFIGRLIDKGWGPVAMTACTVVGGLCLFALSWVTTLLQFYIIWFLIGSTLAGCLYEPCFALVTRSRGINAKKGITLITLIAGFASTISFPLTHTLAGEYGWSFTVRVFALIVIVLGAPLMWSGTRALEAGALGVSATTDHDHESRSFMREPAFWCLAMGFGLLAVLHGITLHHLLPILKENGITASVAVTVASLIGPMQVAGRLIMMSLESRASNHALALGCFALLASAVVMLMLSAYLSPLVYIFVALFGGAYGTVSILRPVLARDILGEKQFGAKSGVLAMVYLTGAGSAPLLGSVIWSVGGYQLVLPCCIAIAVAGLLFYIAASRNTIRKK